MARLNAERIEQETVLAKRMADCIMGGMCDACYLGQVHSSHLSGGWGWGRGVGD